jgi:hypothetical protein
MIADAGRPVSPGAAAGEMGRQPVATVIGSGGSHTEEEVRRIGAAG